MILKRREFLRWGAVGAGAALFSSAGAGASLPAMLYNQPQAPADPLAPLPQAQVQAPSAPAAPAGIEPALFERAKAAMNQHSIWYRDVIGIVDFSKPSSDTRFHVVDLQNGSVASYLVAHGRGSDPDHSGYLQRFSNEPGSYASSNGTYTTGDIYDGKHGTSMRLAGLARSLSTAHGMRSPKFSPSMGSSAGPKAASRCRRRPSGKSCRG
jgi:hypothetical protein